MSTTETAPAGSRWWTIALGGVALVVGVIAVANLGSVPPERPLGAVAVFLVHAAFFLLVTRRAAIGSAGAIASILVTMATAGTLTALVPGLAVIQFWMYPLIWVLSATVRSALIWTALAGLVVFGGFAISTGDEPGWALTAGLTQVLSYAVNIVLGLWISAVYRYAEERERLLDELTAAQDELAALHRDAGTTAERQRLSRELHDTIAQSLAGTVLLVQRARRELDAGELGDETLTIVEESARTALAETRALVADSAPVELRDGGLGAALGTLAARFRRETGLAVEVDVSLDAPLGREVDVALLRCAQEALANIRAHAGARRVVISLTEEADAAVLRVGDDGRGFDPASGSPGFGLAGLRARLALLDGTLSIDGTAGAVSLTARIPRRTVSP